MPAQAGDPNWRTIAIDGSRRSSPRGDAGAPTRAGRRRALPIPSASPPPEWPTRKPAGRKDGGGGASLEVASQLGHPGTRGGGSQIRGGGTEEVAAAATGRTRRRWQWQTGRRWR
uniref:Uncharacterized protein n=1 Tax=Oryza nivara TaxID=4536 RepID=A0A0E0HW93_ORYNI